jgi:ATP-dependent Clp endopeptidase proteolytic subunit ClpP
MNKWYQISDKADKAEVWIYEEIGEDFWTGGGVTAKNFQKELSAIKAGQIDLHINSPGGAVFDGITIYNLLRQHPANVTTYIDGIAASIASVIALAGDKIVMAENALYMIHNPSGMVMGTAADMRTFADTLDKVGGSMVTAYTGKTGKDVETIKALLDAETWFTADEAKEMGFVDEISEEMDMAACVKFIPVMAKAGFKKIPKGISAHKEVPSERDIERALRDAGCSSKIAKTILVKGYPCALRDEGQPDDPPEATVQRDVDPQPQGPKDHRAELLAFGEKYLK